MPRYTYTAKVTPAKITHGSLEAESEQDAILKLSRMGYFPVSVRHEAEAVYRSITGFKRIPRKDMVLFTRQLATLIESGVNILNALTIVANQMQNKSLQLVLNDVSSRIKDGKSFSGGLEAYPKIFSFLYCAMVRTGEASGQLQGTMRRLADFLEEEQELRDTLRASLTYPLFVLAVSAATVAVLLMFVVPKLVGMFSDMGQALPVPTQILITISAFLQRFWFAVAAGGAIIVFLLRRFIASPRGKIAWDAFALKSFIFGPLLLKTETSRLARTMSLLLSSGLSITPALEIAGSTLENALLKSVVLKFREQISGGTSLSEVFRNAKIFPEFVVNIIAIGEETGSLDKSLMSIAVDYERDVSRTLKEMMRLLEPLIILVMGLIVGFIVISMLLPIFEINLAVR